MRPMGTSVRRRATEARASWAAGNVGGLIERGGGAGVRGGGDDGDLSVEVIGVLVQALLLHAARGEPGELRAEEVRVRREAAGTSEQMAEGLARFDIVDAGGVELALETDEAGLLGGRDLEVRGREEGDDVAGEELEVLRLIALEIEESGIEGDERGGEGGGVEALDHRVAPVKVWRGEDHVGGAPKTLLEAVRASESELPPRVEALVAALVTAAASPAVLPLPWTRRPPGDGVVRDGGAERVGAAIVIAGDELLFGRDKIHNAHPRMPDVTAGGGDVAAQGDGVVVGGRQWSRRR